LRDAVLPRTRVAAEQEVAQAVRDLGEKSAPDRLRCDSQNRVSACGYEHNRIRRRDAEG
jgi:hypothetical protein